MWMLLAGAVLWLRLRPVSQVIPDRRYRPPTAGATVRSPVHREVRQLLPAGAARAARGAGYSGCEETATVARPQADAPC